MKSPCKILGHNWVTVAVVDDHSDPERRTLTQMCTRCTKARSTTGREVQARRMRVEYEPRLAGKEGKEFVPAPLEETCQPSEA